MIGAALQELAAAEQQQIQDHLLTCRDCLELYLDVRSAQAEAEPAAVGKVNGTVDEKPLQAWLAVWGRKVRETLRVMGKPRRLVPALAAVSLVVLVVILGREEKSRVLPPPNLAMEKQAAPTGLRQPLLEKPAAAARHRPVSGAGRGQVLSLSPRASDFWLPDRRLKPRPR